MCYFYWVCNKRSVMAGTPKNPVEQMQALTVVIEPVR